MIFFVVGVLAFIVGFFIAAAWKELALSKERSSRIVAETRLVEQDALKSSFETLSKQALLSNHQSFVDLAKSTLETVLQEAKGQVSEKTVDLKNIITPLADTLKRYEEQVSSLEKTRAEAYGSLKSQMETLTLGHQALQKETGNLVSALRRPEVRGRWGEFTLRRVVELAGMSEHCDFTEQVQVVDGEILLRPDMIVHVPGGRKIVVDSKVSIDAYLDAVATDLPEEQKQQCLMRHAQQIRKHMRSLSAKNYWEQFPEAPQFVVMFIPEEAFLSAALGKDPLLLEDGMKDSVLIASPMILIALLRSAAQGWRQEQLSKNAQEIATLAKELYQRFEPFVGHVNSTGENLGKAVNSFNQMVKSLESRVLTGIRKFKDLGVVSDIETIEETRSIEQQPISTDPKLVKIAPPKLIKKA